MELIIKLAFNILFLWFIVIFLGWSIYLMHFRLKRLENKTNEEK